MILAAFLLLACVQPEPLALAPSGEFSLFGGEAQGIDFDAAGQRMMTYGWFGDVVLWDLNTLEVLGGVSLTGDDVGVVALHPTRLVGAVALSKGRFGPSEVCLVDLAAGRVIDRREGGGEGLAWNEEGDALALGGRVVSVFDVATDEPVRLTNERKVTLGEQKRDEVPELAEFAGRWRGWRGVAEAYHGLSSLPGNLRAGAPSWGIWVAHAPRGDTSVVADRAGQLHVCRVDGVRAVVGHLTPVKEVAFTPDGGHVAARGANAVTFATWRGAIVGRLPGAATLTPGASGSELWLVEHRRARLVDAAVVHVLQTRVVPVNYRLDIGRSVSTPLAVGFPEQPRPTRRALALGSALAVTVASRPALWSPDAIEVLTPNPKAAMWSWAQHFVRSRDGGRWAAVWYDDEDPEVSRGFTEPASRVRVSTVAGQVLFAAELAAAATSAALSPDGEVLALGLRSMRSFEARKADASCIELRDAASGEVRVRRTCGVPRWLGYVDADTLLVISDTGLEICDATTFAVRQTIDLGGPVGAVDLSLDGTRLAIARGPRVQVYSLTR